jgi:CRISPR-associated protein Cas1
MATYYVREMGATIQKQDERLLVVKDKKLVTEIPLHQLDQLVVIGEVQITTQSLALLMRARVDVVFMRRNGGVLGRIVANESRFAELRLRQLQAMSDPATMLRLARKMVVGKVFNQIAVLEMARQPAQVLAQWTPALPAPASSGAGNPRAVLGAGLSPQQDLARLRRAAQGRAYTTAQSGMREMLANAGNATNPDSLRGYEGKAAAWYWPAFRVLLADDMGFERRLYNPAPDPMNALLSFGYALLQKDVTAAVQLAGLDPYLGFFHTVQYGRPSLVLDVMEAFRPIVVDALVLRLVNWGQVRPRDFLHEPVDDDSGERSDTLPVPPGRPVERARTRPISLTDSSLKRVIQAYEGLLTSPVLHPTLNVRTPYRRFIELQVYQLVRVLKGEEPDYEPFLATLAAP